MILVFGKTGQVASELQRLDTDAVYLGRDEADLTDPAACAAQILAHKPSCVINAAAYTAVDKAEDEPELAQLVNAASPKAMAEAAQTLGIPFLHVSTDYVFDGAGEKPFEPDDPVGPLGVYGRTKLAGELGIKEVHDGAIVLRTSWVFSAHGVNFVKSMLTYGAKNEEMRVVADQIGGPTAAADIAAALIKLADPETPGPAGTYHFSGAPDASWADFAREIFAQSGMATKVVDIASSEYQTRARRPLNSRLNCDSLHRACGIARPDWRAGLAKVLKELAA